MGLQKLEVLDHRVRFVAAEFADDAQQNGARLRTRGRKLDLAFAHIRFDVVKLLQKIVVPGDAPVLAVGDRLQSDALLLADDLLDLAIFDFRQRVRADFATLALFPRFFERRGPQQAADMVGAEWGLGALHEVS